MASASSSGNTGLSGRTGRPAGEAAAALGRLDSAVADSGSREEQIREGVAQSTAWAAKVTSFCTAAASALHRSTAEARDSRDLSESAFRLRQVARTAQKAVRSLTVDDGVQELLELAKGATRRAGEIHRGRQAGEPGLPAFAELRDAAVQLGLAAGRLLDASSPTPGADDGGAAEAAGPLETPTWRLTQLQQQAQEALDRAEDLLHRIGELEELVPASGPKASQAIHREAGELIGEAEALGEDCAALSAEETAGRALRLAQIFYQGEPWLRWLMTCLLDFSAPVPARSIEGRRSDLPVEVCPDVSRVALETTQELRRAARTRPLAEDAFAVTRDLILGGEPEAEAVQRLLQGFQDLGFEDPGSKATRRQQGAPPRAKPDGATAGFTEGERAGLARQAGECAFAAVMARGVGESPSPTAVRRLLRLWVAAMTAATGEDLAALADRTLDWGNGAGAGLDEVAEAVENAVQAALETTSLVRRTLALAGVRPESAEVSSGKDAGLLQLLQNSARRSLGLKRHRHRQGLDSLEVAAAQGLAAARSIWNSSIADLSGVSERAARQGAATAEAVVVALSKAPNLLRAAKAAAAAGPEANRLAASAVREVPLALQYFEQEQQRESSMAVYRGLTQESSQDTDSQPDPGEGTACDGAADARITNRPPRWPRQDQIARERWARRYRDPS